MTVSKKQPSLPYMHSANRKLPTQYVYGSLQAMNTVSDPWMDTTTCVITIPNPCIMQMKFKHLIASTAFCAMQLITLCCQYLVAPAILIIPNSGAVFEAIPKVSRTVSPNTLRAFGERHVQDLMALEVPSSHNEPSLYRETLPTSFLPLPCS